MTGKISMQANISPSLELLFDFNSLETELAESKTPLLPLKMAVKSIYEKQIPQFQEKHNIAADNPTVVQKIETFLGTARTESPYFPAVLKKKRKKKKTL